MIPEPSWCDPCYSNRLVQPFLGYLRARGRQTPIMAELAAAEVDARLPIRELARLLDRLVLETGDEFIGLGAAKHMPRAGSGVSHFAAVSAATLGEALRLMARYTPLVNEAAEFSLEVNGATACLEMRSRVPLSRAASDFQVAVMALRIAHCIGATGRVEVWLHYPDPIVRAPYRDVLGDISLRFDAPCDAVLFDSAELARPLPSSDPDLHSVLVKHADELLARVPNAQTLTQRVRTALLALVGDGEVHGHRVAAKLGMSRRSLTRHLEQEQTSYSAVLNDVRRELALQLLARTDLDVQEVAARLGYSLTAAFSRAFRRWEGVSPVQYRKSSRAPTTSLVVPALSEEPYYARRP